MEDERVRNEKTPAPGICHARGMNADLPPQWLIYVVVENLERSIEQCAVLDGELLAGPKSMGETGSYCVLRDPAGAVVALFEHGT